ncbi:MAG TPA: ATP-binding protein [Streptosporangiaceae bacterium]|nr:ATP-binding protein [Streptosporangiaceae bacterium]
MPEEPGANPSPPGQAAVSGTPGAPGTPGGSRPFPAGLPMLPRLRLSACHRQAAGSTATEADWLDVLVRPGGTAALVIGHAEGPSGLIAAAAARLRAGLREQLHAGAAPAEALARLAAAGRGSPGIRVATASLAVLDPATGQLRYASAGQPWPVICEPAGADGWLARSAGEPAAPGAGPPEPGTAVLPAGAVVLLYGRRPGRAAGKSPAAGAREVADAVSPALADGGRATAAELADRVGPAALAGLTGDGGAVAVLAAYRLRTPVAGWSMSLPAEPLALRQLRVRLRDWLQELGAAASDRTDLELAVWEAAVNAIVHGRPPAGDATITVRAALDDAGRAVVQVSDRGRWRPPGGADPGRGWPGGQGLSVIRQATDELDIAPGPAGTTVTMRRALSRPVQGEAQPGGVSSDCCTSR